jgi:hypothetical protein
MVPTLSCPARSLVEKQPPAMPRDVQIVFRGPPRPLLERMQDVDGFGELRDIQHAMLCPGVNTDFTPSPTLGIGFQSFGSSPRWTRQSWNPAIFRTSAENALTVSRASPSQIKGLSLMSKYTKT